MSSVSAAELLQALCTITSDFIAVINQDGRYEDILPTQLPGVRGVRAGELTMHDVMPGPLADQFVALMRQVLHERRPHTLTYEFTLEGASKWYTATVAPLNDTQVLWTARDVSEQIALERAQEQLRVFEQIVENVPDGIGVANLSQAFTYTNRSFRTMFDYNSFEGVAFDDLIDQDKHGSLQPIVAELLAEGTWQGALTLRRRDSSTFPSTVAGTLLRDHEGRPTAIAAVLRDMTAQIEDEEERLALQQQVIDSQQAILRELSTPLVPVADEVVVMPLVGTIDSTRAQQVMETLLEGIVAQQAGYAILDITGVKVVDTQVAAALMRVAQAAKLLGTQVILTGIGAEVAQALVHLGTDLGGVVTRSNLQSGIAFALDAKTATRVL